MSSKLLKEIAKGTKGAVMKKKIITYFIYNSCATITDLAKEMDLSVPTVTKFVEEMVEEGYVNECGKLETSGGRHPNLYCLNADSAYFIGVDVSAFYVNIALIDFRGEMVMVETGIPFKPVNVPENFEELCVIIKGFINKVPVDKKKILNVNIDMPGRINSELGYSHILYNFNDKPISEEFSKRFNGMRVSVDNDTRGMAYGEYVQSHLKDEKNIIFINVSWGLAMGIIIDGKLYKGKSGFAGEFGHNYGYDNEIMCHCGKKGCIETEVSGVALHRILLEHIRDGESSIISTMKSDLSEVTLDDIIDAVSKEDLLCIELVEDLGRKLGGHIAGLINIFNPDLIVIGGDLSKTGDYLLQPIISTVRKYTLNLMNRDSLIIESKLKEKAGIIGSCMLSRSRLFEV
ncbi:ROK family transcriptional regulator [Phocaeicola paurosaccharolyticus]|uniref:ROK family transcriptional regulator n=1 Tax=Phocaeicola paurosaccharolyticus TaxID=732242 RepID=UPI0004688622|nr:ROK family transcriptional regulator [Phocaeicola paurosaccharolyticus]